VVKDDLSRDNTTQNKTMTLQTILLAILAFPTAFWLVMYLIPQVFMVLRPVPDLKKRYNAEWACVTGSGSGIGEFTCTGSFNLANTSPHG
jgi:hypothetical protein